MADELDELIRLAKAIRKSHWYRMQRQKLGVTDYPTMAQALHLVHRLSVYSARDRAEGPEPRD